MKWSYNGLMKTFTMDPTMDSNEDQVPNITREAREKMIKDRLKAQLVLRTPRPTETAPLKYPTGRPQGIMLQILFIMLFQKLNHYAHYYSFMLHIIFVTIQYHFTFVPTVQCKCYRTVIYDA